MRLKALNCRTCTERVLISLPDWEKAEPIFEALGYNEADRKNGRVIICDRCRHESQRLQQSVQTFLEHKRQKETDGFPS